MKYLSILFLIFLVGCNSAPLVEQGGWAMIKDKQYIPPQTHMTYGLTASGEFGFKTETSPAEYRVIISTDLVGGIINTEINKDLWDRLEAGYKVYILVYTRNNHFEKVNIYLEQPNVQPTSVP